MAPFNTHFLIAEKIWPELPGPWQPHYGQFCFGCVAPDVDKLSSTLRQRDTHFYDRSGHHELMATHRTAAFLERQAAGFLRRPFPELPPAEQAFALGYLCHLALDEVSKFMWGHETWLKFKNTGPGPAFAALDEVARERIVDYPRIVRSLEAVTPLAVIPAIPPADLAAMLRGVLNFVRDDTAEGNFLALVDMFDHPDSTERHRRQQEFRATIETARQQVELFELETLLRAGLTRSRQRLRQLVDDQTAEAGYPGLG